MPTAAATGVRSSGFSFSRLAAFVAIDVGLCRVALPLPDDTVLAAASVKGSSLLAWVQQVLSVPPFFLQSAQVAIGRDPEREIDCQINRLQVEAAARAADGCTWAAPCLSTSAGREHDVLSD